MALMPICRHSDGAPENADENLHPSDAASLTFYLKELREFPLLTHAQEIELAKAREEGESLALDHMLSTRAALDHVLRLGEKVLVGELGIRAVVEGRDDQRGEDYCDNPEENDSVRDEFLRKLKRLRRMAADLAALRDKASRVSPDKKDHVKEKLTRQDKITSAVKNLRMCRAQIEGIAARLKEAYAEVVRCETAKPADARERIARIENDMGMDAQQLKRRVEAIRAGELKSAHAKRMLIEANLRLVVSIAKRYRHRGVRPSGLDSIRKFGPDAGGGKIQLSSPLSLCDLCDVVDSPDHRARHHQFRPYDSHPGTDNRG